MTLTAALDSAGKRIVGLLLATQGLASAGLILVFTVASILAVRLAGGNESWAGIPSTVLLLGSALAAVPQGRLVDRLGWRPALSTGFGIGVVGALLAGFGVLQGSLWLFLGGIFLIGISRAAVDLARYAAAEARPPAFRARAISLVVMGGTVGSVAGPALIALAGLFAAALGLAQEGGTWLLAAIMFAIGVLALLILLRPDPRQIAAQISAEAVAAGEIADTRDARALFEVLRQPAALLALAALVLGQVVMVIVMTVTPVHMDHHQHSINAISLVVTAHTFGMFGLSFVTGWLSDRVGHVPVILAGGLVLAISCVMAPFFSGVAWLLIALFLLGLGWNFTFVAGSSLLDEQLRPSEKGPVRGAVDALVKVSSGTGSLGSGLLFAAAGYGLTSWLMVIGAMLIVMAVAFSRLGAPQAAPLGAD